jgi:hypothetical protein
VTGDVEHGIVTPHHAVGRCVDLRVVRRTSPFGECAALCISSGERDALHVSLPKNMQSPLVDVG